MGSSITKNPASMKVMSKAGLKYEVLLLSTLKNGENIRTWIFTVFLSQNIYVMHQREVNNM